MKLLLWRIKFLFITVPDNVFNSTVVQVTKKKMKMHIYLHHDVFSPSKLLILITALRVIKVISAK